MIGKIAIQLIQSFDNIQIAYQGVDICETQLKFANYPSFFEINEEICKDLLFACSSMEEKQICSDLLKKSLERPKCFRNEFIDFSEINGMGSEGNTFQSSIVFEESEGAFVIAKSISSIQIWSEKATILREEDHIASLKIRDFIV